jgi:hypothetical protein
MAAAASDASQVGRAEALIRRSDFATSPNVENTYRQGRAKSNSKMRDRFPVFTSGFARLGPIYALGMTSGR